MIKAALEVCTKVDKTAPEHCQIRTTQHSALQKSFQRCCDENDQISTGVGHKTVPENWQIRTTQNSALQCSYEQETETDNSSNLEVLNNLIYVMALEGELQC